MKLTDSTLLARILQCALVAVLALSATPVHAQDQTTDFSPIVVNGSLPFDIDMQIHDMGSATMPTLQSYAYGQVGDDYIFVSGRTNGLHNFSGNGTLNFPPVYQNTDIWIINPVTQQTWSRSLSDASSGLNQAQVDSLSATSTEFYQSGSTLYVAGGYLYDSGTSNFTTSSNLTALDLPAVDNWVKTGIGSLASSFRQTSSPITQVTGGSMTQINGQTLMTFGQSFEGGYGSANFTQTYTEQVRTFTINDNGTALSITPGTNSTMDADAYHRRDLNVVPSLTPNGTNGSLTPGLVALSGVFYNGSGVYTVPVEITANGTPSMADPNAPGTFKQGMNNYQSPVINLYDTATNTGHAILFGGISLHYYNYGNNTFTFDDEAPFISQTTDVTRDATGNFAQYLLSANAGFPSNLTWSNGTANGTLLFGAGADFLPASGLPMLDNGMIDLQSLTGNTLLGYIYGGIVSQVGDTSDPATQTTASSYIFDVYYTPSAIPEPAMMAWLIGISSGLLAFARKRGW
ncbi:MAG TPA: hypothetical protein VHC95_10010, partial [Opitutales bacterium]|nr:hypothetical protein [Opitutales bacterium]